MPIGFTKRSGRRQADQTDNDDIDFYNHHMRKSPGAKPYATDEFELNKPLLDRDEKRNAKQDEKLKS